MALALLAMACMTDNNVKEVICQIMMQNTGTFPRGNDKQNKEAFWCGARDCCTDPAGLQNKAISEILMLWLSTEYFLIENRQCVGFDAGLPGEGLLIYHVDENVASNQSEWHPKVALMQVTWRGVGKKVERGGEGEEKELRGMGIWGVEGRRSRGGGEVGSGGGGGKDEERGRR
jgi:hypothetical protein